MARTPHEARNLMIDLANVSALAKRERANVPEYSTEYIMWTRLDIDANALHDTILSQYQHKELTSIEVSVTKAGFAGKGQTLAEIVASMAAALAAKDQAIAELKRKRAIRRRRKKRKK